MKIVLVALGGFGGALLRWWMSRFFNDFSSTSPFPLGTLLVNVLGSFLLGYLYEIFGSDEMYLLVGVGFLGSFTTFSTFQLETVYLWRDRKWTLSILYFILTYVLSICAAWVGYLL
ncbi:fluoride efflux transporter CrcB [Mechercharimyces sp. CAU 1602]|uniref:fluoride efflux transporter CrcB n=1 Tax=Mechercharimyces sp. CAU 1602 TaxID=2973933 RepID=UPI002161B308|nr:fluoride efflux transporter CrcB [Mechercharimyces sp. CAU 1602]MCS1350983.1 fluoride efflux transporter CrcB [Mechercharimyces sp. CAU 1602]